jgi:hypothetical protein
MFTGDVKDGQNGSVKESSTVSVPDSKGERILLVRAW